MDNKLFTQVIDSLQKGIDTLKEALKPKTEFKIGWVYKDDNGIEFVIEEISDNLKENYYPIRACKPNNSDAWRHYTLDGMYYRQERNEKDLILESGRPYKEEKEELEGFQVGEVYRTTANDCLWFYVKQIDNERDFPISGYYLASNTSNAYKPNGLNLSSGMPKEEWDKKYGDKQEAKDCKFKAGWVYEDQKGNSFFIAHICKDTKEEYPVCALMLSEIYDISHIYTPYWLSLDGVSIRDTVHLRPETGHPYDK